MMMKVLIGTPPYVSPGRLEKQLLTARGREAKPSSSL